MRIQAKLPNSLPVTLAVEAKPTRSFGGVDLPTIIAAFEAAAPLLVLGTLVKAAIDVLKPGEVILLVGPDGTRLELPGSADAAQIKAAAEALKSAQRPALDIIERASELLLAQASPRAAISSTTDFASVKPHGLESELRKPSFIDLPRYPWESRRATALRDHLMEAYPSRARTEHLAKISGVRLNNVCAEDAIEQMWNSLLEEAARQGQLRAMLQRVLKDSDVAAYHVRTALLMMELASE